MLAVIKWLNRLLVFTVTWTLCYRTTASSMTAAVVLMKLILLLTIAKTKLSLPMGMKPFRARGFRNSLALKSLLLLTVTCVRVVPHVVVFGLELGLRNEASWVIRQLPRTLSRTVIIVVMTLFSISLVTYWA